MEALTRFLAAFLSRNALPLLSALLLTLSFPNPLHPAFFSPGPFIALFCLVPLLLSLEGEAPKPAFAKGYAAGFFFFLASTAWINHIRPMGPGAPPAWISLSAYMALYPAFFSACLCYGRRAQWPFEALWMPALWTLLEYLREHLLTGFPWLSLGSSQINASLWLNLASITGVYGLHFAVASGNLLLFRLFQGRFKATLASALVLVPLAILTVTAPKPVPGPGPAVKVAVLQGNINFDQEWTEDYRHQIMTVYGRLMLQAADAGATVILWPEDAYPGIFKTEAPEAQALIQFAKNRKVNLIFGASMKNGGTYYNGAIFISETGQIGEYRKRHLVPFGEYIPLRSAIPLLDRVMNGLGMAGWSPGTEGQAPFRAGALTVAPLVCYESIYGELLRKSVMGAGLVSVVTLDTWFGPSAAPRVHFNHSVLRAVENHVWVARSAATGVSGFIAPDGNVSGVIELDHEGFSLESVPQPGPPTFYSLHGPWFLWLCLLLLALELTAPVFRAKKLG